MSTHITRLRGSSSADLLAIPVIMLGFHPRESCVVLGVRGTRVEFCARMDLNWFTNGFSFGEVADQLEHALETCAGSSVAILGYSSEPEAAAIAVAELMSVVGSEHIAEALVTDGDRYWFAHPDMLLPPEGIPYSYSCSNFAAQAVYSGVNVTSTREDAVAAVQPPSLAQEPAVAAGVASATRRIAELSGGERWELLARHLEAQADLGDDACEVAVLLQDEEHFAEVLARLTLASAARLRPRLAEVRRQCTSLLAANVVALLALACWLDGEGAQQSDCLSQLERLDPLHPLMGMLTSMHRQAIPPSTWDE